MGLKSFNPYTASRRFITVVDKSHITKQEPEKALLEPKKRSGGRNNHGEIVIWHRGGGHKKQYRKVDFRRDKLGIPAKVAAIEYDPNREPLALALRRRRKALHPAPGGAGSGRDGLDGRGRGHSSRQCAPDQAHSARHHGAQPGAQSGARRTSGAFRRRVGAASG